MTPPTTRPTRTNAHHCQTNAVWMLSFCCINTPGAQNTSCTFSFFFCCPAIFFFPPGRVVFRTLGISCCIMVVSSSSLSCARFYPAVSTTIAILLMRYTSRRRFCTHLPPLGHLLHQHPPTFWIPLDDRHV